MERKEIKVRLGKHAKVPFSVLFKLNPTDYKNIKEQFYHKYTYEEKRAYDFYLKKCLKVKSQEVRIKDKSKVMSFIVEKRRKGLNQNDIFAAIKAEHPLIPPLQYNALYSEAKDILRKEFEIEKDFLVDIHVLRYEELFAQAIDPDVSKVPLAYRNSVLAESYSTALEILQQKERALGIHTKTFKLEISNYLQENQKKKNKAVSNFQVLSLNERIELLKLLQSTKVEETILRPISSSEDENEKSTTAEVIVKEIEAPIRLSVQTDIKKDEGLVEESKRGKGLEDVQESIRLSIQRQVEEAMKKKKK
jgi:hypothetical protein